MVFQQSCKDDHIIDDVSSLAASNGLDAIATASRFAAGLFGRDHNSRGRSRRRSWSEGLLDFSRHARPGPCREEDLDAIAVPVHHFTDVE
ncbi:hypothetical protein K8Z49_40675 [Actinomadura madurae]|uniref:hypothetical protein n=1 Tax=Actinomadura madurae TaxID=1993 RepID=UPI003999D9FC